MRSTSCQCRISAKRWNTLTFSALAVGVDQLHHAFGIAAWRSPSARIADRSARRRRPLPSDPLDAPRCSERWSAPRDDRAARELVPTCQSTRSGFSAITPLSKRASMSRGFFAVDAAVEHGDFVVAEMLAQLDCEPARIGRVGRARAGAGGRGRADRHDLDRLRRRRAARGAVQRQLEACKFGRRAMRRGARLRRCDGCLRRWLDAAATN